MQNKKVENYLACDDAEQSAYAARNSERDAHGDMVRIHLKPSGLVHHDVAYFCGPWRGGLDDRNLLDTGWIAIRQPELLFTYNRLQSPVDG